MRRIATPGQVRVLSCFAAIVFAVAATLALAAPARSTETGPGITPDAALERLRTGNESFASGKSAFPRCSAERRTQTAREGQKPIATVLGCSDSRAPLELLFDQGIGDLFVVRVAGNVASVDETGSVEYAVGHLGTPVIVVLGHSGCGAVTAVATGAELHGSVARLAENIRPAVEKAKAGHPGLSGEALVPAAIEENVWRSAEELFKLSAEVRERVREGTLKVVGAVYDLSSGRVTWLGPHPGQARLAKEGVAAH